MKKKIVMLSVALMVAAAGVASAGAAWGKYKGYDIIRLTVNGQTVKATDAPAISFNDRTMVPIYMLKEAGVSYSWNQETNTVDVQKSTSTSGNSDTNKLKAYFKTADIYKQLEDLGGQLSDVSQIYLSHAFTGINTYNDRTQLDKAYDALDLYINIYNNLVNYVDSTGKSLKSYGISTDKMNTVLNNYFDAIDHYKDALSYLESYYKTKSSTAFNNYLDASSNGSDTTYEGQYMILTEYPKYKNLVLSQ